MHEQGSEPAEREIREKQLDSTVYSDFALAQRVPSV
jgi:hypothetical protein